MASVAPSLKTAPTGKPLRPILLYSGWQTANIGDVGHTPGTLRYLQEAFPGYPITLWLCRDNPDTRNMIEQRFPSVKIVQGKIHDDGRIQGAELEAAFDHACLFIQNSGMHFNRFWGGPISTLQACLRRGLPFGLYGQSFDGFVAEQESAMRTLLSKAAFILTRETKSLNELRRLGVKPGVLDFVPDGCFGIDVRNENAATDFLRSQKLSSGRYLCVTLRSHSPKSDGHSDLLNPASLTDEERRENEAWASHLREVITDWVEQTGLDVLLTPEVDKEIEPARRLILDKLPSAIRQHVRHRKVFWNVDEAVSIYAHAAAVLSMEPHSCIIALAHGTPALHWYSPKHGFKAHMFRDIGLGSWLFNIAKDDISSVVNELFAIRAKPSVATSKIQGAMQLVHRQSLNAIRQCVDIYASA